MERKIIKRMSPNHYNGRGGEIPIMIVNHITEGAVAGAVSWLCNPKSKASAHYVVARNGDIYQLVDLRNGSWCNGTSIYNKGKYYYKNSTNSIVKGKAVNANLYTVSIEHEGYSYKEGRGALTDEQYQSTLWLHRHIINEVKSIYGHDIVVDREHIIGHYEVAPREKPNCPGQRFPWDRLMKDLQNKGGKAVDKDRVKFDFKKKKFTVDGKLIDGHNYVQARELLEKLGYTVGWDNALKEVKVK